MNASIDWFKQSGTSKSSSTYLTETDVYMPRRAVDRFPSLLTFSEPNRRQANRVVVDRLRELLSLSDNWDSYGARTPSPGAAIAIVELLNAIMGAGTPAPFIAPSPDGHFQAEWHTNGVDLEVEVFSSTKIDVYFSNDAESWHESLTADFTRLVKAIDLLSD